MTLKIIFLTILSIIGSLFHPAKIQPAASVLTASPTSTVAPAISLVDPIANFRGRATKKLFGTFVTPGHSPISPERFRGYHTGVDVEYTGVSLNVPVFSIADGLVVRSGWVSGYGGMTAIHYQINGSDYVAVFGHLNPDKLLKVGDKVSRGQQIGILGDGYTRQTDGERKHLHFALHRGAAVDIRGYVPSKSELSAWIDPLSLIP